MTKKRKRKSEPVLIGEILPEVMADIKKRMMRHRSHRNDGGKKG